MAWTWTQFLFYAILVFMIASRIPSIYTHSAKYFTFADYGRNQLRTISRGQ